MKPSIKAGVIGFGVVFVGLLIVLFIIGQDSQGWVCATLEGPIQCSFLSFLAAPLHWAFILFFSWVGFIGGLVDMKIINKIIANASKTAGKRVYLKITSTIMLTLVLVFGLIGVLAFEDWVGIMVYAIIFTVFIIILSWIIDKFRYRGN